MKPERKLTATPPPNRCRHPKPSGHIRVTDAGFDAFELGTLEIMRHYFATFGNPATQSWMRALELSFVHFPQVTALTQSVKILAAVQAMRRSRRSMFCFSSPTCPDCAQVLTDAERHLMAAIHCIRIGRSREAQTHAMLLCEGNDATEFLAAVRVMCRDAPDYVAPSGG